MPFPFLEDISTSTSEKASSIWAPCLPCSCQSNRNYGWFSEDYFQQFCNTKLWCMYVLFLLLYILHISLEETLNVFTPRDPIILDVLRLHRVQHFLSRVSASRVSKVIDRRLIINSCVDFMLSVKNKRLKWTKFPFLLIKYLNQTIYFLLFIF